MLKFIVSTDGVRGIKSMELPDSWGAVNHDVTVVRSVDETWSAGAEEFGGEEQGVGATGRRKTDDKVGLSKHYNSHST